MDISDCDIDDSSVAAEEEINKTYSDYIQSLEQKNRIKNISKHDISQILVEQIIQEESYVSVLYKVMKLLNDKENDDLGIENADFITFLKTIGINSLKSIWSALIGLGVTSIIEFITTVRIRRLTVRIRRLKKGGEIKIDSDNSILLNPDEIKVLVEFFIKQVNSADFRRQMVQADKTIPRKHKKELVNKLLEIKLAYLKKYKELVSTRTISGYSEVVKELVGKRQNPPIW